MPASTASAGTPPSEPNSVTRARPSARATSLVEGTASWTRSGTSAKGDDLERQVERRRRVRDAADRHVVDAELGHGAHRLERQPARDLDLGPAARPFATARIARGHRGRSGVDAGEGAGHLVAAHVVEQDARSEE